MNKKMVVEYLFHTDGDYCVNAKHLGANINKEEYITSGVFICEKSDIGTDHIKKVVDFLEALKKSISSKNSHTLKTIQNLVDEAIEYVKENKPNTFFHNFEILEDSNWDGTGIAINTIE